MDQAFVQIVADLNEKEALALAKQKLDTGDDPLEILDDARLAQVTGEHQGQ